MGRALSLFTLCLLAAPLRAAGDGKVFLTVDEALKLAFPECEIERTTRYLGEEEEKRVETLSRAELESRVVRPYVARHDGKLVGTAYFDAHRVRTKNEVLMIVVAPDERIVRVEVLAFAEPLEYLPRGSFYAQFAGRRLDSELDLKGAIRGIAGASLSATAATSAARRTLALHRVLAEQEPAPALATSSASR